MPTYEYQCQKCGLKFERFQNIKEEPIRKCPECSGSVKKLISAGAGIIFKGSGFYITDYRSDNYKKAEKNEKEPASDTKSTDSETKTKKEKDKT
jgi:putative FmdB family regulatory protein